MNLRTGHGKRAEGGRCVLALLAVMSTVGCTVAIAGPPIYPPGAVEVPPGHLPPPGECRIWYPGRPAGHQPPPGPCHVLEFQVPPGAFLVYGG